MLFFKNDVIFFCDEVSDIIFIMRANVKTVCKIVVNEAAPKSEFSKLELMVRLKVIK